MNFADFEKYVSHHRINRYLVATHYSKQRAINLYKANLKIAQAFHPLLGIVRVVIRNQINNILSYYFDDKNWIINQKQQFTFTYVDKKTKQSVFKNMIERGIDKSLKKLKNNKTHHIRSDKTIEEQTFGFGIQFFDIQYYKLLQGKPIQVFHKLSSIYGRKQVNQELETIRIFRNRINHNEPICFKNNEINFTEIEIVYNAIINIWKWIDPHLIPFLFEIDWIEKRIDNAKKN